MDEDPKKDDTTTATRAFVHFSQIAQWLSNNPKTNSRNLHSQDTATIATPMDPLQNFQILMFLYSYWDIMGRTLFENFVKKYEKIIYKVNIFV